MKAMSAVMIGTGHRNRMFGSENQRSRMRGNCSGVHRLTIAMKASTAISSSLACSRARSRDRALGLHHQPAGAEQRIAGDDAEPAEQRERRREIERAARELAVLDLDALDQAAEDQALAECRERRAGREREGPVFLAGVRNGAEFERDAAEDQRQAASRSPADTAPA